MKLFTSGYYNVQYDSGVKADHFSTACVHCVRSHLELRGRVAIKASNIWIWESLYQTLESLKSMLSKMHNIIIISSICFGKEQFNVKKINVHKTHLFYTIFSQITYTHKKEKKKNPWKQKIAYYPFTKMFLVSVLLISDVNVIISRCC